MLESENQYVGPVFGFFCDRAERNISFFYFPVFHFKRISLLHKAMLHIPKHTRSLSGSLLGYKTIP